VVVQHLEEDFMPIGPPVRESRSVIRIRFCLFVVVAAALLAPGVAAAATTHAPAYSAGHLYRHGVVPFRGHQHTTPVNSSVAAASANDLTYRGGVSGVGVTTGAPRVYLVFWGSQWGTQGTNSSGYATYSGDSVGMAPDIQAFFKGLGTGNERWSGVMTQYCQGIATGAQTCPGSNTAHVGYPTGGALAGVWEDTSAAAPAAASGHQIGLEAVNAATHFGNTTQASNRNTQYFIISPHNTNPDNYETSGFCAWHDYTGDTTLDGGGAVSSPDGLLAFTNMPYLTDVGASCGQGFVNNPGTLDGVTIVGGHEYAETITDQYPAGGWTDSSGNENGDKCAWISSGQGASQNISLSTGSFAVQSTWANDFNGGLGGCEVAHSIVTNGGNTVTVTSPGNQTSTVGTAVSVQITATDSASGQTLGYTASGLPAGLSINSSSGLISGTPTTGGTSSVTVTATDTTGAAGSASFSWTVNGDTVTVTNPGNQGTNVGTAVSLQIHATDSASGQTLTYSASGLPTGLSINGSTGLISGTPTATNAYSVTVKATDTTGASGSASFTWTITVASACTSKQLLGNPGFETGSASPWSATAGVINPNGAGERAHSGSWYAWLDGYGVPHTDTLAQPVTISGSCHTDTFSFWLWIDTSERSSSAIDTLKVQVLGSSGTVLATLATYSNLNANNQYVQKSFSLSAYAGQTVTVKFTGTETDTGGGTTDFVIDDTALNQAP
jgi:serine protease